MTTKKSPRCDHWWRCDCVCREGGLLPFKADTRVFGLAYLPLIRGVEGGLPKPQPLAPATSRLLYVNFSEIYQLRAQNRRKFQPKTMDTRLWEMNPFNYVVTPQRLVLKSIVLG